MEFPAGLRVLAVDDDRVCLLILETMLRQCRYRVTTCDRASDALRILRENRDGFDVVISDVHMPDMDGFKLLEHVGLEMDLPVIMMSANDETSAVMKGIKHGACDYLLKPVRIEELKLIWQHVVRKRKDDDRQQRNSDAFEAIAAGGGAASSSSRLAARKRRDSLQDDEEEAEVENEDPSSSSSKKPRVVWSVDLHQKFVAAVDQLGIDKAVPKRILELMDVAGLTRENVASHLQKYRLYLKRLSAPPHQPSLNSGILDDRYMSLSPALADFRAHHLQARKPNIASSSSSSPMLLDRANSDAHILAQMAAIHGGGCGEGSLGSGRLAAAFGSGLGGNNSARFGLLDKNYGGISSSSGNMGSLMQQRLVQLQQSSRSSNPQQISGGILLDGGSNGLILGSAGGGGNNGFSNAARAYGTTATDSSGIYSIPFAAGNVVSPSISLSPHFGQFGAAAQQGSILSDRQDANLQAAAMSSRSIFGGGRSDGMANAGRFGAASLDWLQVAAGDGELRLHQAMPIYREGDDGKGNVSTTMPPQLPPKLEMDVGEAVEPLTAEAVEDLWSYMKQV